MHAGIVATNSRRLAQIPRKKYNHKHNEKKVRTGTLAMDTAYTSLVLSDPRPHFWGNLLDSTAA
jgi:hypothetical protein